MSVVLQSDDHNDNKRLTMIILLVVKEDIYVVMEAGSGWGRGPSCGVAELGARTGKLASCTVLLE